MTLPHLSDEQVADYLSGVSPPATASHLAHCAECRDEIDRMRVSISSFNQASMAWSEKATMARSEALAAFDAKPRSLRSARAWHGIVGVACALVVACVLLFVFRRPAKVMEVEKDRAPYVGDSTAEIERDNQLLGAIDGELDSTGQSPEKMYGGASSPDEFYGGSENRLRPTP